MKKILSFALALAMALTHSACSADNTVPVSTPTAPQASPEEVVRMKIRLDVGEMRLSATLTDNKTTRDFISLLPLTLTLEDYAGTEKISNLPGRLSTEAPLRAATLLSEISRITLPGEIWRYFTKISGTQAGLSFWEG
jgi:hypothetical protein